MEPEKQTVTLYDFLYKDANRLASYYAQLFGGRLSGIEKTDSTEDTSAKGGKAGVAPFLQGEYSLLSKTASGQKQVIDPHELITVDLLAHLVGSDRVNKDITAAPHGSLILAEGTLLFIDRHMIQLGASACRAAIGVSGASADSGGMESLTAILDFLQALSIPSAFVLVLNDGRHVVGTIKESGLEEPISAYYFKHGADGLANVYLAAIKEVPSPAVQLPSTGLLGAGQQAAKALSNLLFPEGAFRVTPIVLFRKL